MKRMHDPNPVPPTTEAQKIRAALKVCAMADTADEAHRMMDMLGLLPEQESVSEPDPGPVVEPKTEPRTPISQDNLTKHVDPGTCPNGHPRTPENRKPMGTTGKTRCLPCHKNQTRAYYVKNGGRVSKKRKRDVACINGHPWVEGSYRFKSDGVRQCLECVKDWEARKQKKLQGKERTKRERRLYCQKGHPWKPETTRYKDNGHRMCLVCREERWGLAIPPKNQ